MPDVFDIPELQIPPADANCHHGICSQDECGHCSRIGKARYAAAKMELALRAIKLRLHFVGHPQEPRNTDGRVSWAKEIAYLEEALAALRG